MPRALSLHPYDAVRARWPATGNHIIASYTDDAVLVYQAFNDDIADYALARQRFAGCPRYNATRMTWVKTNFLWMMKRSGYASKKNQTRILGLWLRKAAFDDILSKARFKGPGSGKLRVQWDPDYSPELQRLKRRRDIQLGIKQRASFQQGDDFIEIVDYTEAARTARATRRVPDERVYLPEDEALREYLQLGRVTFGVIAL